MHKIAFRTHRVTAQLCAAICSMALLAACSPAPSSASDQALAHVRQWVQGAFNNVAQFEADMAANLPPEKVHRPMHQLFVPVKAPLIDGYIVYQQSSMDGSENPAMIFRHGLMQYIPDPDRDALIQRELYFKEPEAYKNLHHNPELLQSVDLEQMTWNAGCDFYLRLNAAGDMVSGPLRPGQCELFNEGLQKTMYADDLIEITASEYRFRGRYVDADGNILWGTASDELNRLQRQ